MGGVKVKHIIFIKFANNLILNMPYVADMDAVISATTAQ